VTRAPAGARNARCVSGQVEVARQSGDTATGFRPAPEWRAKAGARNARCVSGPVAVSRPSSDTATGFLPAQEW